MALFSGVPLLGALKGKGKVSRISDEIDGEVNNETTGAINGELKGAPKSKQGSKQGSKLRGKQGDKLKDKISEKVIEAQNRINEIEVSGGPVSRLRLWRSFLGWVLSLTFAWEVLGRGILNTYWPELRLPPPMLKEISHLLLGMLGLGF